MGYILGIIFDNVVSDYYTSKPDFFTMTTVQVPYTCKKCKNQFSVTMKLGEPMVSRLCLKCGGIAIAPENLF
ncbi:MAG: hypothetical protein ABI342_01035 [Nitrososphaera sp.]